VKPKLAPRLALLLEHLVQSSSHLPRSKLLLAEQLERVLRLDRAKEVGDLGIAEALLTRRPDDAAVEPLEQPWFFKANEELGLMSRGVWARAVQVEHLVRERPRRTPEGRRERLDLRRHLVDVRAAEAMRIEPIEQAVAQEGLDG
jgi:hypothetical protein